MTKLWKYLGYTAKHDYIRRKKKKPENCELCGCDDKKLELSNKEHTYSKDLSDWRYICKSCHKKLDYKLKMKKEKEKNPFSFYLKYGEIKYLGLIKNQFK